MIYGGFIKGNLPKIMDKGQIYPCRPPGLQSGNFGLLTARQQGFLKPSENFWRRLPPPGSLEVGAEKVHPLLGEKPPPGN